MAEVAFVAKKMKFLKMSQFAFAFFQAANCLCQHLLILDPECYSNEKLVICHILTPGLTSKPFFSLKPLLGQEKHYSNTNALAFHSISKTSFIEIWSKPQVTHGDDKEKQDSKQWIVGLQIITVYRCRRIKRTSWQYVEMMFSMRILWIRVLG